MSIMEGSLYMTRCECGRGTMVGRGTDLATGITKCKCEACGRELDYHWGKRDMKTVRWQTDFFVLRKQWARDLLDAHGLHNPGDTTEGDFEGMRYIVSVGPRRGVRIWEKR